MQRQGHRYVSKKTRNNGHNYTMPQRIEENPDQMVERVSPPKKQRYEQPINSGYINLKNGGYDLHKSAKKAAANSLSLNVIKTTNAKTERNK